MRTLSSCMRSPPIRNIAGIAHIHRTNPAKPTVVFINGMLTTSADFRVHTNIQQEVAQYANTVCFEPIDFTIPPDTTVDPVALLYRELQIERMPSPYILCGHSLGSVYGNMFALRYPYESAALVSIEGPGELRMIGRHILGNLFDTRPTRHVSLATQHLHYVLQNAQSWPVMQRPRCPVIVHENLVPAMHEVVKYFKRYSLANTTLNTLLVYMYLIVRHRIHVHLTSGNPWSKLHTYVGRTHNLHCDEEDAIIKSIVDILSRL